MGSRPTILALREALREVPGVGPRSEEEARAWWDRWRARRPSPGGNP
jgi:hypothetical protein